MQRDYSDIIFAYLSSLQHFDDAFIELVYFHIYVIASLCRTSYIKRCHS